MHEFALYGQVAKDDHHLMLQQLAGYTRMQPQDTVEIHLVFRGQPPAGLDHIPSAGGSQGILGPDLLKIRQMLTAGIYYVQLIGEVLQNEPKSLQNGDTVMTDGEGVLNSDKRTVNWTLEFKDTPDAGKQAVSTRLISRTPLGDGDLVKFLEAFDYE